MAASSQAETFPLRIAQISPLYEAVPPRLYGGTERIVAHLSDALVQLGHEVTLFATAEAQTLATLVPVREQALRLDPNPLKSDLAAHLNMLEDVLARADQFDVLHFHTDMVHMPVFRHMAGRTVTTLHGRLDMADLPEFYRRWPQFPLVSISDSQQSFLPEANWAGTVLHGLATDHYALPANPAGDYLAFLGRISPEKRPDRAIEIAKRAGMRLRIAAKVDNADKRYFEDVIEPMLDHPLIEFIGEIGDAEKSEFLGNAAALLFPIDWPEPFGLVMIEAMACGTPVIAWNCGSVPEVIEPGITGVIVDDIESAVRAVGRVGLFNRAELRQAFEDRFSGTAMARRYLALYGRAADARQEKLVRSI